MKINPTGEQVKAVEELTGYSTAKAEKYLKEVWNDLAEDEETTFNDVLEVIQMEFNVKANNIKNIVVSEKKKEKKEKKPRTVKTSNEKIELFNQIYSILSENEEYTAKISIENKLILIKTNTGKEFKLDLIETRAKK